MKVIMFESEGSALLFQAAVDNAFGYPRCQRDESENIGWLLPPKPCLCMGIINLDCPYVVVTHNTPKPYVDGEHWFYLIDNEVAEILDQLGSSEEDTFEINPEDVLREVIDHGNV